jgi:hypothetical protein
MQFIPYDYEPQRVYRPVYYEPDMLSYLAQQDYGRRLNDHKRQQMLAAVFEEQERRREHEQYMRYQLARQREEEVRRQAARQRAVLRQREEAAMRHRHQEQVKRVQAEREARHQQYYSHPAFDVLGALFGAPQEVEESIHEANHQHQWFEPQEQLHEDQDQEDVPDPDVSVPSDEDDLYANSPKMAATVPQPPFRPFKNPSRPNEIGVDDLMYGFLSHMAGSPQKNDQEDASSNEASTSQSQKPSDLENSDSVQQTVEKQLKDIQGNVQHCVETYERLFSAESSSDSESGKRSVSSLTSRMNVLQKAQIKLEQLYTELDGIQHVPEGVKKLKHELTNKSVAIADKIDDLVRVLESHRTQLLQKAAEQTSEDSTSDDSDEESQTPDRTSSSNASTNKAPKKHIRRVMIETVDDDSDF